MTEILDDSVVSEIEAQLNSGSLLLPLRVEGWHKSLTDGGHIVRHATGRTLATVEFVPVENDTGRPALDGNAPTRAIVTLLNSIPALCATVKHLRAQVKLSEDWRGTALRERDETERLLDAVRKRADTNHAALNDLQSQLEQLRAENETRKTLERTEMIISKLATDVARGVYSGDAEFFQRDLDRVIANAIHTAVQSAQSMWPTQLTEAELRKKRESFHSAECLNGHVWDDVNSMDDQAFTQASCPFGGGLFSRCGATLTINYIKAR